VVKPAAKLRALADSSTEPLAPFSAAELRKHIASEQCADESRPLAEWQAVGPDFVGRYHPSRPTEALSLTTELTSAEWHAVKHTGQGEWIEGTTTEEYLADIRASVLHASSVLDVGREANGRRPMRSGVRTELAAARTVLKKTAVIPDGHMFTVYDPERRRILTGFPLHATRALAKVSKWTNHRSFQ